MDGSIRAQLTQGGRTLVRVSQVDPITQPDVWNTIALPYDAHLFGTLTPLTDAVVARLGSAKRVLEVAAGSGNLTLPLARSAERVVAIDFAERMIARLDVRLREAGVGNVETRVMDGHALAFEDASFDAAVSMYGVFLFADRARALAEMLRVVRPDGVVMSTSWSTFDKNEVLGVGLGAMRTALPDLPRPSGPLPTQQPDVCAAELRAAGAHDVTATTLDAKHRFASVDAYWEMFTSASAPFVVLRKKLGDAAFDAALARARAVLLERFGDGPFELGAQAILTTGVR